MTRNLGETYDKGSMGQESPGSNGQGVGGFFQKLCRTKQIDSNMMSTPLKRCLNTFDITLLGVGHMIGAGIYVLTGTVAKSIAGPAIIISYIIAGVTSLLAALCYAEFGARVPKAGSAYVYTYVTIGEFFAFVIGWDVVLEHMIGSASVARAWSGYLDGLLNGTIEASIRRNVGEMHVNYFGEHPDFLAFSVCIVVSIVLIVGVKGSSYFNSVFTMINLFVISFVICVGFYFASGKNWSDPPGGFMPFGFAGVISGAAKCFYAYVGFDSIATSSEEAKNPGKAIPRATFLAMAIAATAYMTMSSALTLMIPYNEIQPSSAFPDAFHHNGAEWAKWVVSVGALAGMTSTMFGGLFALPRCIYAMATDGLIFKCFAYVHPKTQTPVITLIVCSLFTALIALVFDIDKLVDFMSIGTLMAYNIVSASVIILRYRPGLETSLPINTGSDGVPTFEGSGLKRIYDNGGRLKEKYASIKFLNAKPGFVPMLTVLVVIIFNVALSLLINYGGPLILEGAWWPILLICVIVLAILACVGVLYIHEQTTQFLIFRVPLVPVLPVLSLFCNIFLLTALDGQAWLRFLVWMAIGFCIYFGYGIWHSKEPIRKSSLHDISSVSTAQLVLPDTIPANDLSNPTFSSKEDMGDGHTKF